MANKHPIDTQQFEVRRHTSSSQVAHMTRGLRGTPGCREWKEPRIRHRVIDRRSGAVVGTAGNGTTLCLPRGNMRAINATDEQIIRAVVGDEHIYTGERSYQPPEEDAGQGGSHASM